MTDKSNNSGGDYKVGYKKPPKETQWKKGQSGNPNGKPKTPRGSYRMSMTTFRQFVMDGAWRPVSITEDGESKKVPIIQVILTQLNNKAAQGNIQAAKLTTKLWETAATKNDRELHEWILDWSGMQERKLRAEANPGSLEHFNVMYQYFMFKKDIRRIEGVSAWPYEKEEPITNEDWHLFIKLHDDLKADIASEVPWPLEYPSNKAEEVLESEPDSETAKDSEMEDGS